MAAKNPLLLMIEDDRVTRRLLAETLAQHAYEVVEAGAGKIGLAQASTHQPDLILLDLGLPDMDGIEVARALREWYQKPIIILTIEGQEERKVEALDAGADDYVTKPFSVPELLARIRAALRTAARLSDEQTVPVHVVGEVQVDVARHRVLVRNEELHLTPTEYKMLVCLIKHAGQVVTHRQLLKEVWGPEYKTETNYLRVYMKQLRQKLEQDPANPRYLLSEQGVGYRFAEE